MFFILACLFLARRYGTSAAPIASSLADSLAYNAPVFTRDECSNDCSCPGRSVWDILWSCLATTFAVTWVSVHPNTPFLEEKSWPLLKRRIFLMCLALLAPEVMIMWAFKQWRGAVKIRETINEARPKSCVQWTMAHAHFLQMGGFKLNVIRNETYISDEYCYETKKKGIVVQECVLHFDELQDLLEKQLIDFPDTTANEIEDRSKGDALSKGVALLQITWFIIQLIARAHQHLTITEIELTTAALAGLNSIMYLFWWNKPLDVRCPIVIRTKKLESQLANGRNGENESQNSGGSGEDTLAHSRSAEKWTFTTEKFRLRDYLRDSPAWVALDLAAKTLCPIWMRTIFSRLASFGQSITSVLATHLRSLAKWLLKMIRVLLRLLPHRPETDDKTEVELQSRSDDWNSTDGSEDSVFRRVIKSIWRTCMLVVTKLFYLPYLLMFLPMDKILDPFPWYFYLEYFSDAKNKMDTNTALQLLFNETDIRWIMAMMFYSEKAERRPLLIFSALAGAAFGSIHCAAWHFEFPSPVERILWRTASLSIVGVCLSIVGGIPIRNFLLNKWVVAPGGSKEELFWSNVRRGLDTIPAIIYPLSRVSLLILALISLRKLPDSAFNTVTWTMFIPHI